MCKLPFSQRKIRVNIVFEFKSSILFNRFNTIEWLLRLNGKVKTEII